MVASAGTLSLFLLIGGSLLAGYVGHVINSRWRVSDVVFLLLVGLVIGPLLGWVDPHVLTPALFFIGPLGLIIVLFEGGLELAWSEVRRYWGRAAGLTLTTWTASALGVTLVTHLLLGWAWSVALLFGLAICATGILVVIPLLAHLKAPGESRVLLTVETSLGDLMSAVAVAAVAGILVLGQTPLDGARLLGLQFLLGAAVGFIAGLLWARALTSIRAGRYGYALTLGALLAAYAAAEALGGSGFLMALTFGLVVGNAPALVRFGGIPRLSPLPAEMRLHQSEIIFILRSVYFVYLGLVVPIDVFTPWNLLAAACIVAALVVGRIVGVRAALAGRPVEGGEATQLLLVGMMPRGLAAVLIAGLPAAMGVPGTEAFLAFTFLVVIGADVATSIFMIWYSRVRARQDAAAGPAGAAAGTEA